MFRQIMKIGIWIAELLIPVSPENFGILIGEIKSAVRTHHAANMGKTFVDMIGHEMGENRLGEQIVKLPALRFSKAEILLPVDIESGAFVRQKLCFDKIFCCGDGLV